MINIRFICWNAEDLNNRLVQHLSGNEQTNVVKNILITTHVIFGRQYLDVDRDGARLRLLRFEPTCVERIPDKTT